MKARILLVDDHSLLRSGLAAILKNHTSEWELFEATDGEDSIKKASLLHPDLILMDYSMPRLDGVQAAAEIKRKFPEIKIIMVSMELTEEVVIQAMVAGVKGFIPKDSPEPELLAAIHEVLRGRYHLTGRILEIAHKQSEVRKRPSDSLIRIFSRRETDVLRLVVEGMTSVEIAAKLNISKRTVDHHRSNLLAKSGTNTQAALIRFALKTNSVEN
jgi:DNA-binding NarL/FixJ family response regulator